MTTITSIRKTLRPIRRLTRNFQTRLTELPYKMRRQADVGSADWLIRSEIAYGGLVTNVARHRVSPLDDRTADELAFGGMTGGDRMLHHGYAPAYSRYLAPFLDKKDLVVAEFGILKGTGLAIWCDLFPDACVMGFDIDIGHFQQNEPALRRRGAFKRNQPEVHDYDQLVESRDALAKVLRGRTLDIVIDDGLHTVDAIVTTWRSVAPHLSSRFAYFIEDHADLLSFCGEEFRGFSTRSFGMLTVVSAGLHHAGE